MEWIIATVSLFVSYGDEENVGKVWQKIIIEQLFSLHLNVIVVLLQATSKDSKENNNYKIGYKLREIKKISLYIKICVPKKVKRNVVNTELTTTAEIEESL